MDALNGAARYLAARLGAHPEQIGLVERLIEAGHAYVSNGSVYFDVSSWPSMASSPAGVEDLVEDAHRANPSAILRFAL